MKALPKNCKGRPRGYHLSVQFLESPKLIRQFQARISQLAMMADLPDDLKPDFPSVTTCHHEWK